jgi:hypothetical protein
MPASSFDLICLGFELICLGCRARVIGPFAVSTGPVFWISLLTVSLGWEQSSNGEGKECFPHGGGTVVKL